ncbi:MAG: hypothetical protein BWK80_02645 [Desulfobacteraceae bacterium IS3]|nr:MAG: hypothetical protein BWK80_02645 [Desulfobacteraceae bacterium IS3]
MDRIKKMSEYNLFEQYRRMEEQHIFLAFYGTFSEKTVTGMSETIKEKLSRRKEEKKLVQRVFSIFVELAQNISRYSAADRTGIIVVAKARDCYFVRAGNFAENKDIPAITDKINHINALDENELRDLYIRQLKSPRPPGKTGGSVGLIGIVRESGNPICLTVTPGDGDLSFIAFSVTISRKGG